MPVVKDSKIIGNVSCRDIRFTVTSDPDKFLDMKIDEFIKRLKKSGSSPGEVNRPLFGI